MIVKRQRIKQQTFDLKQMLRGHTFIHCVTPVRKSLFRRSSKALAIRTAFLLRAIAYSKTA